MENTHMGKLSVDGLINGQMWKSEFHLHNYCWFSAKKYFKQQKFKPVTSYSQSNPLEIWATELTWKHMNSISNIHHVLLGSCLSNFVESDEWISV